MLQTETEHSGQGDSSGKLRALVVDDEGVNLWFLVKALKAKGYEVVGTVSSGENAVEQARLLAPDFILMDVNLGAGISGLEATRRIMAERPVPVIVVSAYSRDDFLDEARRAGATGYATKKVSADRLHREIQQAFERFDRRQFSETHPIQGDGNE